MKRDSLHTSMVGDAHAYTRSRTPWILDNDETTYGRLIHYISGGGMRAFGRTVRQEEMHRRHVAFGVLLALCAVVWLLLLIF